MRIARWVALAFVLVAAGAAAWWQLLRPVPVVTVAPHRGDAAEIVYATGVVEPRIWAKVTTVVRERLVELCDCEGETVRAGDVLARLDQSEAEASLNELEERLRLAVEEQQRLSVLRERNATSQRAFDQAQSEVTQFEALVAGQKARLENYVLRAPTAGVVLRREGEVGEIAEPGEVLFWVGRPQPLVVIASVNEEDIPRVVEGQRVLLSSDAFPGRVLDATVDHITPMGDPIAKTFRVRLSLPADTPLRIGMTVDVNIVIRVSEKALLLPSPAARDGAVVVAVDGRAHRRDVETGIVGTRDVEILSGLTEADRVIAPYPEDLADGARVETTPTGPR